MSALATTWKTAKTHAEKALKDGKKAGKTDVSFPKLKGDFQKNLEKLEKFEAEIEKLLGTVEKLTTGWVAQCGTVGAIAETYKKEFNKISDNDFSNVRSLRQGVKDAPISTLDDIAKKVKAIETRAKALKVKLT